MTNMKIFLDMDGVLVNFIAGAAALFGYTYKSVVDAWIPGVWKMEKVLGIEREDFYYQISKYGSEFWSELPEFNYTRNLIEFCQNVAPTYVLTTPVHDPECPKGKLIWLRKVFGNKFNNYIFTAHKELCARTNHVLIDDKDGNIISFKEAGGHAILFPSITNSAHKQKDQAVEVVKEELLKIKSSLTWQDDYSDDY